MSKLVRLLETVLFGSRWLLAPLYLGMLVLLALVVIRFFIDLVHVVEIFPSVDEAGAITAILTLIDLSLTANLVLLVLISGYENFVARMDHGETGARPVWMGHVDFTGLKLKLVGSVVAITAVEFLRGILAIPEADNRSLMWQGGAMLAFALTGVLLALSDRIGQQKD